ncbi:CU044_2847 family protein [Actinoplanes sp. NPDC048796]|uniref:CU044_2847 family protein n=1 Tax=unclassified Actinoplanes TaxID=2626549 RepID=UPI0033ECE25A
MELAEFHTEDGTAVLFELARDDTVRGTSLASRRGDALVAETGKRLEQVTEAVRPAVNALKAAVTSLDPEEVTVEFGVKLTLAAGVVIASGTTEAHFKIICKWSRDSGDPGNDEN